MGHARSIVTIDDPRNQLKVYNQIIDNELSVRKVEELVRKLSEEKPVAEESKSEPVKTSTTTYDELKNHLTTFFNTQVQFSRDNNGKGKIVIPFKTDDELERIIAIFDKLNT